MFYRILTVLHKYVILTIIAKNVFGDVTYIYNAQGAVVGKYRYTAFGECIIEVGENGIASLNPIRYRSYYYDDETGLYYLKSRYYDPVLGRFMTIDDISYLDPETINGLNLYVYCGNNPVMRVDPNGTFFLGALAGIGAVAGLIYGIYKGSETKRTQQHIDENYSGVKKTLLTLSNIFLGYEITSMLTFDPAKIDVGDNPEVFVFDFEKHKNYNIFTSFMYAWA
ncbi:MAG: RHS repeat-associated core domain-containing protein [Clostridia bacterium]|nr:RHS repeat-associated core domain-containing protein [Clostridia bacterium]